MLWGRKREIKVLARSRLAPRSSSSTGRPDAAALLRGGRPDTGYYLDLNRQQVSTSQIGRKHPFTCIPSGSMAGSPIIARPSACQFCSMRPAKRRGRLHRYRRTFLNHDARDKGEKVDAPKCAFKLSYCVSYPTPSPVRTWVTYAKQ